MSYPQPLVTISLDEYNEIIGRDPFRPDSKLYMQEVERIYGMIVYQMQEENPHLRFKTFEKFIGK